MPISASKSPPDLPSSRLAIAALGLSLVAVGASVSLHVTTQHRLDDELLSVRGQASATQDALSKVQTQGDTLAQQFHKLDVDVSPRLDELERQLKSVKPSPEPSTPPPVPQPKQAPQTDDLSIKVTKLETAIQRLDGRFAELEKKIPSKTEVNSANNVEELKNDLKVMKQMMNEANRQIETIKKLLAQR